MRGKVTKTAVERLEPKVRADGSRAPERLWDTEITGFGCLVTKAGTRSYIFQYRLPGESSRTAPKRITIGKHGDLTPDQARKIARDLLLAVKSGVDPRTERESESRRFRDLARVFLEDYLPNKKRSPRPSTVRNYELILRNHLVPEFGPRQVAEITRDDIERLHRRLGDRPYMANRMLSLARQVFRHAERMNWLPLNSNPAALVDQYPEQSRGAKKAVMLSSDQMHRLREAINAYREEEGDPYSAGAIEFVFWTGWRISEVLGLRWENVDPEQGVARLVRTKTEDEEHRVVPQEALRVIQALPRLADCPWVFVGRGEKALTTVKRPWQRIRGVAGLDQLEGIGALRIHDLRHNVVSWDVSRGVPLKLAGRAVGHKSRQATEIYAHFAPDALKRIADERALAMKEPDP